MAITYSASAVQAGGGGGTPAAVEALAGAITAEVRLLEDLIGVMRKQRSAVSADDLEGVDDSVFATHRILVTLGEARRQRRSLSRFIAGSEEIPLRALDDVLGERMTDSLRDARDGLRAVAITLSREVEINRQVLRGAISGGSDLVRSLYGSVEAPNLYAVEPRPDADASGLLVNRKA